MSSEPISKAHRGFPETRWSLILAAPGSGESTGSPQLEDLAARYWRPVCAYIRSRWAKSDADALDLTQDFFLWMLQSDFLTRADPERGRFRGLVKVSLDRFLLDHERKRRALKRGGDRTFLRVGPAGSGGQGDGADGDGPSLDLPAPSDQSPEEILDATWRAELIERATESLERELTEAGHALRFAIFRDYFLSDAELDYGAVAERHGVRPSDVSNHLMAAKKRFREHLRRTVIDTVESSEDLEAELRWLLADGSE